MEGKCILKKNQLNRVIKLCVVHTYNVVTLSVHCEPSHSTFGNNKTTSSFSMG